MKSIGLPVAVLLATAPCALAQGQFFDSDGARIHYTDRGEGTPVILIHGAGGSIESWERTKVPATLIDVGFRVIALDLRGHGHSDTSLDPAFYGRHLSDDVVALLDHIRMDRAHMVGYSMGATIVLRLIAMHQDRVLSAVLGGAETDSESVAVRH